jgi:AraC-like DNA-binding protein
LLQLHPELKDLLFDFTQPGKLDLEAFMNQNFRFNISLERFAYLTGRSLSTFKRDFVKVYSCKPGKWLQQRRLQEAYYLIKEKGIAPVEVYTEVGFEDLSHFSSAFKKQYGSAPSKLRQVR